MKENDYINFLKRLHKENSTNVIIKQKWEDLSEEEKGLWDRFSQSPRIKIHILAYKAFQILQSHGLSEDIIMDELKLSKKDKIKFRKSFEFFKERHKKISRRSAEKKFESGELISPLKTLGIIGKFSMNYAKGHAVIAKILLEEKIGRLKKQGANKGYIKKLEKELYENS